MDGSLYTPIPNRLKLYNIRKHSQLQRFLRYPNDPGTLYFNVSLQLYVKTIAAFPTMDERAYICKL